MNQPVDAPMSLYIHGASTWRYKCSRRSMTRPRFTKPTRGQGRRYCDPGVTWWNVICQRDDPPGMLTDRENAYFHSGS